jgi:hypothetical protein
MTERTPGYVVLLLVSIVLITLGAMTSFAADKDVPDIKYLIRVAQMTSDWTTPPMGGPVQRYIKDISTGKTYLVEVDYWGSEYVVTEH